MNTRRIPCGEITLSAVDEGSGPVVVLLHGFPEINYSWRYQIPALVDAGYRVIAPDLRGYGESDAPLDVADYAFPHLVGDIVGLLDACEIDQAHLVGHDWGGSIAWGMSALSSERVLSLTILNSPHPVASAEVRQLPVQAQKSWYMLLFQFPGVAEEWLSGNDFANLRDFFFKTAAHGTFSPQDQDISCAALARPGRTTAALNYYRANMPPQNWLKPPPDLPPITVPTTIIWGQADAYMSEVLLERSITKVRGKLTVERLPGVSHWVQQEVPDTVNTLLVAALERTGEQ